MHIERGVLESHYMLQRRAAWVWVESRACTELDMCLRTIVGDGYIGR
jgi:hypothetical protein